ncbi:14556_t:CDS:2, partial [Racocetra persica]
NTLESLYYEVNKYGFASPDGVCPYLGVGGLIPDNILDAQNGTVFNTAKEYTELLWAIKGAGNADYETITSLTLRIHPVQKTVTSFSFEYDWDQIPLLTYAEDDLYIFLARNAGSRYDAGYYKVKSLLIRLGSGLSDEGAKYLVKFMEKFTCNIRAEMLLFGGEKVNEIGRNETALVNRGFMNHLEIKIDVTSEISLWDLDLFS